MRECFLHSSLSLFFVSHPLSELLGCILGPFGVPMLINPLVCLSLSTLAVLVSFSLCAVWMVVLFSEQGRHKGLEKYKVYLPAWFVAIRLDPDLDGHQH